MQEEIEHKTVNFAISTVKLSARTLLKGAQFFLRQYDKSASQGKQSMNRLIRQNRGVTNLEIEKTGIKDFDRYAKRYHIDYAIQKDLSCTPPRYLIFFKAQDYGIHVGRNGMACCPFHNDKTPSMKLDRRYHCFGCGADGDVIDFAAALYGLGKKEAAVQLAQDFGLSYEDWKPPGKAKKPKPRQKSPEEQFQEAKNRCFRILADYLHLLMAWRTEYAPHSPEEAFHPRFVEALQKQAHVEYQLDVLLFGETEEKAALITDYGKDVIRQTSRRSAFAMAGIM